MNSKKTKARMESGEIIHQKCWQYIQEVNGTGPEHLSLVAVTDSSREYIAYIDCQSGEFAFGQLMTGA